MRSISEPVESPAIGRLTDVGDQRVWVAIAGEGGPVVVLEPAIGDVGSTWGLVLPLVARRTRVLTRDRPGLGRSERSSAPRDVDTMVAELRATLTACSLDPPYVLVGHSFASLLVRAFAELHRDEVAGMVLVDGAHEDQLDRFPVELNAARMLDGIAVQLREFAAAASRGEVIPGLTPVPVTFSPALAADYREVTRPNLQRLESAADEYESLASTQDRVRQLSRGGPYDFPLIALRHSRAEPMAGMTEDVNLRYEESWVELQEELAGRSIRGEVRVADGAGHLIHHDRPDLVFEAITDVIAAWEADA